MKKTISLPQEYNELLRIEKERTGLAMSVIIRKALDYYFSAAEVWQKKLEKDDDRMPSQVIDSWKSRTVKF